MEKYLNQPYFFFLMRGRPITSPIRQNIVEILNHVKEEYAYNIYKIYCELYPKVTMRSIYYHLRKGEQTKEFIISRIEQEKGDYSWGSNAEKIYYKLGPNANPKGDVRIKKLLQTLKKSAK